MASGPTVHAFMLTQSYLTLCNPMDCSRLASSVHGIFQARILEWVAISFFRVSWKIPWMEEPGRLPIYGVAQSWTSLKPLSSSSNSLT